MSIQAALAHLNHRLHEASNPNEKFEIFLSDCISNTEIMKEIRSLLTVVNAKPENAE